MRRLIALAALVAAFVFLAPVLARSQQDIPRGLGHPDGPTHWYDSGCCSMQDCEPLEPGAVTEISGGYFVQYRSSRGFLVRGFIAYDSPNLRPSRDAREHACATAQLLLCLYLPLTM